MSIVSLNAEQGSYLCSIALSRRADGSIAAELAGMPAALIETTGSEVPDRVAIIADWLLQGACDMERQAKMWAEQLAGPTTPQPEEK